MLKQRLTDSKFAQSVGILTVANVLQGILGFTQGILVARWLGPESYGIAALVMSYPGLVYTVFDARSSDASVKYLSEFHARGEKDRAAAMCMVGYMTDFAIVCLALMVVMATAPWAAHHVAHQPQSTHLILLYAAAFVPRALAGTSNAVLVTLGNFNTIALLSTLVAFLRATMVVSLVWAGKNVAGVIWGNAAAMIVEGLLFGGVSLSLVRRKWGMPSVRGWWSPLFGYRREVFKFLAYNDLNALLGMVPKQLDIVLLGYFRNPTEVGYYKLARSLAGVAGYLAGPLQSVTYPRLAALIGEHRQSEFWRTLRRVALRIGLPLSAFCLLGIPLAPIVVRQLIGSSYVSSIPGTQILMVGYAGWVAFFWLRPAYMALGEIRAWVHQNAVYALILLVGMGISIPRWGYLGLALSLTMGHLLFYLFAVRGLVRISRAANANTGPVTKGVLS
ncbi:MAG: lipopolysaccharide biosynthesis protein [Armatimonadetes bacterium]|nr:lipopolysaccharide biosynthesis protein [Armatimonadota bacterium]